MREGASPETVSADDRAAIRHAAERVHPVFVAQGWTWHGKGVPTVEMIAASLEEKLAGLRAEHPDGAWSRSSGRLVVQADALAGWRFLVEVGHVPDCAITRDCGNLEHQHYLDYLASLDAPEAPQEPTTSPTTGRREREALAALVAITDEAAPADFLERAREELAQARAALAATPEAGPPANADLGVAEYVARLQRENESLTARATAAEGAVNAARAFAEEVQEDHPAIDAVRLRELNAALDAYDEAANG